MRPDPGEWPPGQCAEGRVRCASGDGDVASRRAGGGGAGDVECRRRLGSEMWRGAPVEVGFEMWCEAPAEMGSEMWREAPAEVGSEMCLISYNPIVLFPVKVG